MKIGEPTKATCAACMKRKKCVTIRYNPHTGEKLLKDNFVYSKKHCGWLCIDCLKRFEEART